MIIGIAIPSFIAVLGGLLTYGYINDVENRQGIVSIADDLKADIFEVRRNEKNFLHHKSRESLESLHNTVSSLDSSINIITKTFQATGKEELQRLKPLIKTYLTAIDDLYDNYLDEISVTEQLMTESRQLENILAGDNHFKELNTSFILNLRHLETNYMISRNRESFLKLDQELAAFKGPHCRKCKPYVDAVSRLFRSYESSDLMENSVRSAGSELERISGEIARSEREKISSFITMSKRLLIAALVLLCTLGPLFVYKTANYIVAPIIRIDDITRKISEGDISLRAPIKEHDETSSLAISFNKMLDHMNLTHESLEKSMELLTEKQAQLVDSEKRASLGLLVSGVAHELNNPLSNISVTAEIMTEDSTGLSRDDMKGLNNILMQCERAKNIVNNLLDFARARKSTVLEKLDTVSVVKESFNLVANQMRINKIELEQDIPDEAVFINGNRSKLEQIFVSVFTNAIQAMKENGTLSVSLKPRPEDKNVIVKINDTGLGIPAEDIKNIFEPFFTTKPVSKGTGLGLSVCKSLVMEHDGEINVESRLGKGTTFTIKLPLHEETA
jgi:signal transduction histidine kinase